MTEMDPATSAQCVSMTLFSDRSAVVWSCTSVSSSIEMRPAAEERPRAGTMEMGPATAMLEPFSLDPSRYLSTPYAYARFHCGEISRRGHPLISYPFSVLNDQPIAAVPLASIGGALGRDEPPFKEGCDEPEGGVSGERVSPIHQAADEGENIAMHPADAPHDPTGPAHPTSRK